MGEETAKPSGRKRGRPRTVTNEQEVPERRRKQLRLAQQAYRKRKETTIGNLQNRVHELEAGIENISQSFLSFSSLLIEEQLLSRYPNIASALQNITQQCVSLAKAGSDDSSEGALPLVQAAKESQITNNNTAPTPVLDNAYSETSTDVEDITRSVATRRPAPPTPPYEGQSILPFDLVMPPTVQFPQFPHITPPSSNSPTLALPPSNITPDRPWNIAQRLVRTCCQGGYRLLVDYPNSPAVQRVFGSIPSLSERNRIISEFYAVMQDKTGVLTDPKAHVLHGLQTNMNMFSNEQLQLPSKIWQIALESTSGDWMDANGVQGYLRDKRVILDTDSSGRLDYSVSASLDSTAFIKSLSREATCVGNGPVFPRQSVEKLLRQATISVPWDFDNLCDL